MPPSNCVESLIAYSTDDNYMFMYQAVIGFYKGGLSLQEAKDMPCDEFMLSYRNAIIQSLSMSEEGREILRGWGPGEDDDAKLDRLDSLLGL